MTDARKWECGNQQPPPERQSHDYTLVPDAPRHDRTLDVSDELRRLEGKSSIRDRVPVPSGALATAAALVGGLILGNLVRKKVASAWAGSFHGRTVVITGGSRGLGLVLAHRFGREGARLAILARNQRELYAARDELVDAGCEVYALPCDIRQRETVEAAVRNVARRFGHIDVLVNNAGIIQVGPAPNMNLEEYEQAMATNFWGALYAIRASLPYLERSDMARIVNVASFGGLMAIPHMAPYTASKFALVGLSDALRAELHAKGIKVTTVAPGPLRTGSHVNAYYKGHHEKEYGWFTYGAATPGASTSPRRAAGMIVEACRRGDPRLVIGLETRMLARLEGIAPSLFARGMELVAGALPSEDSSEEGHQVKTGWDSRTPTTHSKATWLADREIERNHEHLAGQAPAHTDK